MGWRGKKERQGGFAFSLPLVPAFAFNAIFLTLSTTRARHPLHHALAARLLRARAAPRAEIAAKRICRAPPSDAPGK